MSTKRKKTSKLHLSGRMRLLILLCALTVGFALYDRIFPDTFSEQNKDNNNLVSFFNNELTSCDAPLRGTIYDRNYKELAVSHLLYKLYCEPAKLNGTSDPAQLLANIVQEKEKAIMDKIHSPDDYVEISDNLSLEQALAVEKLAIPGIFVRPYEIRYYPSQTTAAHALGYTQSGQGVSGAEEHYDSILQPGMFSPADIPEIEFSSHLEFAEGETDIRLTLDLAIQKKMERLLHRHLRKKEAKNGMALILDPRNGSLYSMSSFPSYNPNVFWQAKDAREINSLTDIHFSPELIKPLLEKSSQSVNSAMQDDLLSEHSTPLPPISLNHQVIFEQVMANSGLLDLGNNKEAGDPVSGMDLAVTAAGLINGGLVIDPYILESVYNHKADHSYTRSQTYEQRMQHRVFSPTDGVRIRRALSCYALDTHNDFSLYSNSISKKITISGEHRLETQEILLGWSPNTFPQALVVIVLKFDDPAPLDTVSSETLSSDKTALASLGNELISLLHETCNRTYTAQHPDRRNRSNHDRLLATRRLNYQPKDHLAPKPTPIMPEVTGLSLRQGLKLLDKHHLPVKVKGSGRIVKQNPAAGAHLNDVVECTLTLESSI